MGNYKVAVLLSTYNGEHYIVEQIDSIIKQNFKGELLIVIRDDGSTDQTYNIIENKYSEDNRILLFRGENIGCVESFFWLIRYAVEKLVGCEYYAFSDQDDVWLDDKVSTAVNKLNSMDKDKPSLYASRSYLVTEKLELLEESTKERRPITFYNSIIQNFAAGHTQVINRCLLESVADTDPKRIYVHDSFILNVAIIKGDMYFDNTSHVLYRQHKENQLGASKKKISWIVARIKRIKRGDNKKYSKQIYYICKKYHRDLTDDQKKEVSMFFKCQKNLALRFIFAIRTRLFRQDIGENLAFKLFYILGGYKISIED